MAVKSCTEIIFHILCNKLLMKLKYALFCFPKMVTTFVWFIFQNDVIAFARSHWLRTMEAEAQGFLCPECMLSLESSAALVAHFESAHNTDAPKPPENSHERPVRFCSINIENLASLYQNHFLFQP